MGPERDQSLDHQLLGRVGHRRLRHHGQVAQTQSTTPRLFARFAFVFCFFCPTLLTRCCFSLSAGDQCVPGPNAAPGPLSGQEGRQAGHQSVVHRQHHPGGLQDTAGKHAGASRGRLQDRHGNFTHRMPHYRAFNYALSVLNPILILAAECGARVLTKTSEASSALETLQD